MGSRGGQTPFPSPYAPSGQIKQRAVRVEQQNVILPVHRVFLFSLSGFKGSAAVRRRALLPRRGIPHGFRLCLRGYMFLYFLTLRSFFFFRL